MKMFLFIKALLAEYFEKMEGTLLEAAAWPGDGIAKLTCLIELQLQMAEEHGNLITLYLSILGHGGVDFFRALGFDTVQIGRRYHELLSVILKSAIEEGSLAPLEPNFLSAFFFSFFTGLLVIYGKDWKQIPTPLLGQAVLRLLGYRGEISSA